MKTLVLFIVLCAALAVPSAAAAHLTSTAADDAWWARGYDNGECIQAGYANGWRCANGTLQYPSCRRPAGWDHTRTCHGIAWQKNLDGRSRTCEIVTHYTHGTLSYHWNYCRHPGPIPV